MRSASEIKALTEGLALSIDKALNPERYNENKEYHFVLVVFPNVEGAHVPHSMVSSLRDHKKIADTLIDLVDYMTRVDDSEIQGNA